MQTSHTFIDLKHPIATVAQYTRIRDRIVINKKLKAKLEDPNAPFIVNLIGRVVEHEPGVDLVMPGGIVTIVASTYEARGCKINVSGEAGRPGVPGHAGAPGVAFANTRKPGGTGSNGGSGGAGADGGSIRVICERVSDVNLRADGGVGGVGGAGGSGGNGGKGFSVVKTGEVIESTDGGRGGAAGNGGAGGRGGHIEFVFTAAGVPGSVEVSAAAGSGGAAGKRGEGGKGEMHGERGAAGRAGAAGAAGTTSVDPLSAHNYWKRASTALGHQRSLDWAAYRLRAGVYFYRRFKPNDATREDMLRLAVFEFAAVLTLDPGNADAAKYDRQIELGQNVLGLSTRLDIVPEFDHYLYNYTTWASFVTAFYKEGIAILLAADEKADKAAFFADKVRELRDRVDIDDVEEAAAKAGAKGAKAVIDQAILRVNELDAKIKEAVARKPDNSISIGTIVTTAASVATAVAAVIAAVPTAGTSLFALVPALAGLGSSLNDIGGHIFDATKEEKDALKKQYDKVGKNVDDVVKGAKATVNLVQALDKLANAKTADNAEAVALMRQGVELAYEVLLARLHGEQADLTLTARKLQAASDRNLVKLAEAQLARLTQDQTVLKEAGRSAILTTQRRADSLLGIAFKTERSVEIYTFKDESSRVSFDAGFIPPDTEQDFTEDELSIAELVAAYTQSWLQFLDPIDMVNDYDSYFASDGTFDLTGATLTHNISDAASLATFKASARLSFSFDLDDLPPNRFESKIEAVHIALVGAKSPNGVANCSVRHGGRYLSRRRSGDVIDQPLEPHETLVQTLFSPLNVNGVPPSVGASARQHFALSFWGRGVAGTWEIALEPTVLPSDAVNLDGLTEIQLWVPTQCFIPVN
jgi:hypothetical protein